MYNFLLALFESLFTWISKNPAKGTLGEDAKKDEHKLDTAGTRIRDYIRLRGMQSGGTGDGSKSDQDRT